MQKLLTEPTETSSTPSPKMERIVVTPYMAEAWLEKNTNNRNLKRALVDKYAVDMKSGAWKMTFDPIRFAADGTLLDGQHRLAACVQADTSFEAMVVYGLDRELITAIDIGKSRSTGDVLSIQGYANASTLAAMARWLHLIKNDITYNNHTMIVSVAKINDILNRHPNLTMFGVTQPYARRCPSHSLLGTVAYIGGHILGERETALRFLNVFKTGVPAYDGCPAHKLREFVIGSQGSKSQLHRKEHFPSTVHVWNLFRRGEAMKRLSWPKDATIEGLDLDLL